MDNLKNYFLNLTGDEREAFAANCNTSVAYIQQIYQGHRQCSASLAIEIDKNSNFLSRLCGGESLVVGTVFTIAFLSRLCGGELQFGSHTTHRYFLSRLCGGELSKIY